MDKQDYFKLTYSWDMVLCLEDFINCINLHKQDLRCERNILLMHFNNCFLKNKNFNPAGVLKDYIYLEANSFFKQLKKIKNKGNKNVLDLPDYLNELENFRNVLVGHRDIKDKIKFPEGWIELQETTAKQIPIKKLIQDIDKIYQQIKKDCYNTPNFFK